MKPPAESMDHGRLWSLWDMLIVTATSFVRVVTALEQVRLLSEGSKNELLDDIIRENAFKHLTDIYNLSVGLDAKATALAAERTVKTLNEPETTVDQLGRANGEIFSRFQDELRGRSFIFLALARAPHFDTSKPPFGKAVDDAFPSASEDISEASKCLAFERSTAVVFHLMRAMEIAVQALASGLGVANVEREWGKLLSDISSKIEAMPKGERRDAWSASHSHLYHVKQAWRNSTMHPKKTYTEDESKAVFDAVGSFMRHLAPLVAVAP